jgi:hypothetical protein
VRILALRSFAVLAILALAACDLPTAPRQLAMLDGSVTVRGPQGYCVDQAASRPASGFAVLGACGLFSGTIAMPATDGFITVQIGAPESAAVEGSEVALSDILRSRQGATLLSSNGRPQTIFVDQMERSAGLVAVHFSDSAEPMVEGLEQQEWRAFLDISGRLTTVGVRGYLRAPMTSGQGLALLYETVAALRGANAAP